MPIFLLDLVEQLASREEIEDHIDGVVWLVNSLKPQQIVVTFKTKLSHDSELIDETLFSILGIEAALLRKCFNSKFGMICDSLYFIDWGEVAFSQLFEGFEHLMEAFAVNFFGEAAYPGLNDMKVWGVEAEGLLLIIEEFDSDFCGKDIVLNNW